MVRVYVVDVGQQCRLQGALRAAQRERSLASKGERVDLRRKLCAACKGSASVVEIVGDQVGVN
jgi:hypothetical protein